MRGEIEIILRDKGEYDPYTGENKIIRRGIHKNIVTDIWKMRSAILTMGTGNPGVALRGLSKPLTGQYAAALGDDTFGIYAMNAPVSINNNSVIPPYVDESHTALNSHVEFYCVNNAVVETPTVMLSADNRSVYSYDPSNLSCHFLLPSVKTTVQFLFYQRFSGLQAPVPPLDGTRSLCRFEFRGCVAI